jgi:phospholipase D1/2
MMAVLAALWTFTPLRQFVNSDHLQEFSRSHLLNQWWTILLIVPVYIVGSLLMFPNLALNIAVILSIGGLLGWLYAICGSLTAATVFFFIGHFLGMEKLNALNYGGIDKIKAFLNKGGIASVVAVRALPSAPYAIVNSAAGTFDIRYRDFIIGTFIAHLPGTLSLALLGKQLKSALAEPSPLNISILILILCAGGLLIWLLRSRVRKQIDDE